MGEYIHIYFHTVGPVFGRWPVSHLGEAPVVLSHHGGVGAVQLLDDLEALVELSEDVDHRAGEERVLGRLLELGGREGKRGTF